MTILRTRGLALVTAALALAASAAPAAAYLQYELKNAMISSYSVSGPPADDLPVPPIAAPSPNTQAALPKLGEYAVKGKVFTAAPGATQGPMRRATLRR